MKILISGGCKNGKSSYAQDLAVQLADGGPLYYDFANAGYAVVRPAFWLNLEADIF